MNSNAPRFSKGFTLGTQTLETLQLHSNHHFYSLCNPFAFSRNFSYLVCLLHQKGKQHVVCFPHTCTTLTLFSHSLSFHRSIRQLSTWIRALNIFCSPNHCESRGHFHLGLRRLWPQDFQRLSEVQRPNISSSTALWSILRFHGLYRIDRFLRPDNNLSNIITYRGCRERRSERESSYFYFDGK